MTPIAKFALAAALLLAVQPARAQLMGRLWETNVTLTRADLDMIQETLRQKIHGKPAGTTAAWSGTASGNSGSMTLLQVTERQGQRCERIEYRNQSPEKWRPSDRFVLTSCRQSDGSWKLS
jgi:surface antigen